MPVNEMRRTIITGKGARGYGALVLPMTATVVASHAWPQLDQARELIREYGMSIEGVAACSLQYQRFDEELASLPGQYAPPRGALFLAFDLTLGPQPIGCVALRPLPILGPVACELKRMYVRPPARHRGVGRLLAQRVIQEAAAIGYTLMKLDTSATMAEAQRLYRSMGFVPCGAYNEDPDTETLWFERVIRSNDGGT